MVADMRFQILYGDENCRLDRTTRIYEDNRKGPNILFRSASIVMFKLPSSMYKELEDLSVDGIVIGWVSSAFMSARMKDWKKHSYTHLLLMR